MVIGGVVVIAFRLKCGKEPRRGSRTYTVVRDRVRASSEITACVTLRREPCSIARSSSVPLKWGVRTFRALFSISATVVSYGCQWQHYIAAAFVFRRGRFGHTTDISELLAVRA